MSSFKTQKGTELPLLDLKGKPYLQVAHRILWFREEKPNWSIITRVDLNWEKQLSIAFAEIRDDAGRVIATSHKVESSQGFPDYVEKSETGAIGRALALCGYGTQFAPEFDEKERLADSPIDRPKITLKPKEAQNNTKRDQLNKKLMEVWKIFLGEFPFIKFDELLEDKYGVKEVRLLTVEQVQSLIANMESELNAGLK